MEIAINRKIDFLLYHVSNRGHKLVTLLELLIVILIFISGYSVWWTLFLSCVDHKYIIWYCTSQFFIYIPKKPRIYVFSQFFRLTGYQICNQLSLFWSISRLTVAIPTFKPFYEASCRFFWHCVLLKLSNQKRFIWISTVAWTHSKWMNTRMSWFKYDLCQIFLF